MRFSLRRTASVDCLSLSFDKRKTADDTLFMTTSTAHQKATYKAWRYGWVIYKGHTISGRPGSWSVCCAGDVVLRSGSLSDCLLRVDAVAAECEVE